VNITRRACGADTVRFHWSADQKLIAYKVVGDDSVDFAYDANGRLVKRTVGGTVQSYFLWFGENLFAELDSSGNDKVQYSYYGMDRPHAVIVDDTVYFAHTDGLGNVIGLVNDAKVLKASYEYDFFGYDALGRLVADSAAWVDAANCTWDDNAGWVCTQQEIDVQSVTRYWHDAVGNVDSITHTTDPKVTGTYNGANRQTAFDGCTYQHDADGNVTLRDCASEDVRFHWASDNTLRALKVVGGDSVHFYYDANGRLVKRAVNGTTDAYFLWSGNSLFAELQAPHGVFVLPDTRRSGLTLPPEPRDR
jgi:uncharacterized protein RhaS with RHS repeats